MIFQYVKMETNSAISVMTENVQSVTHTPLVMQANVLSLEEMLVLTLEIAYVTQALVAPIPTHFVMNVMMVVSHVP